MTVQRQNDLTHDTETVSPENQADRAATRRHFLIAATATVASVGIGMTAYPFLASLRPSARVPTGETVAVEYVPHEAGEFEFACQMGFYATN